MITILNRILIVHYKWAHIHMQSSFIMKMHCKSVDICYSVIGYCFSTSLHQEENMDGWISVRFVNYQFNKTPC